MMSAVRTVLSWLPVAASVGVVLAFGIMSERQTAALARQSELIEVKADLEDVRSRLESAVSRQVDVLSRLAGAISAMPGLDQGRFSATVANVIDDPTPILGVAALPASGGNFLSAGEIGPNGLIEALLSEGMTASGATRGIAGSRYPSLVISLPVPLSGPGSPQIWGRTAAVIDSEMLFETAGLREDRPALDLALTAASGGHSTGGAIHLGHASVLARDPVTVNVAMPGGDWQLSATPAGGWNNRNRWVWPIRILTVLSALLIAVPMIVSRLLILERQRHIQELRASQKMLTDTATRLSLALDTSRIGVWEYNSSRDDLVWDARMDELYGYTSGDRHRTREDWRQRLHPDDLVRASQEFADAIRTKETYHSSFRLLLPDGRIRNIRSIGSAHTTTQGEIKITGVNWDVTGDVERSSELEARKEQAEETARAKTRFLAAMSHEIRTPMNGVIGLLDLMLANDLPPEQKDRAIIARQSAGHQLKIVNDLLDLAKLGEDRMRLHPEETQAGQIAQQVVSLLSAVAAQKRIHLLASVGSDVPAKIWTDPDRLRQVLVNLVENALKYTDEGTVEVNLGYRREDGGWLDVAVRDTGIGIPGHMAKHLFDSFVQAETKLARKRGGTGLGLAISKELVELMGGDISVNSKPGQGSTFRFSIRAPVPTEDLEPVPWHAVAPPSRATGTGTAGPNLPNS